MTREQSERIRCDALDLKNCGEAMLIILHNAWQGGGTDGLEGELLSVVAAARAAARSIEAALAGETEAPPDPAHNRIVYPVRARKRQSDAV